MSIDPDGWLHAKSAAELIEWHRQRRRRGKVRCVDCAHRPEPEPGWECMQVRFCARIKQYIHTGGYWRRCAAYEPDRGLKKQEPNRRDDG